jgi:lipid A 4'-phosphatase
MSTSFTNFKVTAKPIYIGLIAFISLVALFLFFPELDVQFHALFYDDVDGFYLRYAFWAEAIYHMVPILVGACMVMTLFLWGYNYFSKKELLGINGRVCLFLLLALAIGPGLVVNAIFKDNWGRARPSEIVEFGGTKQFTPPFIITDQCERNCSFVSGHAAGGFYLLAFTLLMRRHRILAMYAATAFGLFVGFGRIVQGRHFLSDVIFSGFFTYTVILLLFFILLQPNEKTVSR